jgi:sigma-B regulation protein RsbU (phosphoserine phosphatase)
MRVSIAANGPTPITEQIRSQVAASIASLELRSGELLTPVARLAEQLVTSPAAVLKAYRALEADGLCRRSNRGFEVAPATLDKQRERARLLMLTGSRQTLLEELDLARRIQSRLMPPALTEGEGYAVAARVHPAEFVSGDFFDVLPKADGVVDLVVGDVSGKGVGASLIMALVKARLPMLPAELSVAEILRRLNAQLHADLDRRQFVALCWVRFSSRDGRLEIGNAGLPEPRLLSRHRPSALVSPAGPSLPLGVRADVEYQTEELSLAVGERLLLLTDGVPEAPTAAGEPLGYRALAEIVEDHALEGWSVGAEGSRPLVQWLDGLLDRAAAATGLPGDDQTALVLERRGA